MYCPSCGVELRTEDKFCRKCGTQITVPEAKSPWWAVALSIALLVPILGYLGIVVKDRIWKPQGLEGFVPYNPSKLKVESAPVLTGALLRIYRPGDHWTYASSVQFKLASGPTLSGTGRFNDGIYVSTLVGKPVLTERSKVEDYFTNGGGMEFDSNTYFQQDSSRNYSTIAMDEGSATTLDKLEQVQETQPGNITTSPSFSWESTIIQGPTCKGDMKVTGSECTRILPDGQPTECWPIFLTSSSSEGHINTESGMFSPSLGQFVTYTSVANEPDGNAISETGILIAYYLR